MILEPFTIDGRNAAVNNELSGTLQAKPNGGFSYNCINPVAYSMQAIGEYKESDAGSSCKAIDYKDATDLVVEHPVYGFFAQRKAESVGLSENVSCTLTNGTCSGYQNGIIDQHYIVRRLTPTECARLQGFPDWWCDNINTPNPTEEQMQEWRGIFETHRRIVGGGKKSDTQIRKFLSHPHSDVSEYKMWGNGIALPCAVRVIQGIVNLIGDEPHDTPT